MMLVVGMMWPENHEQADSQYLNVLLKVSSTSSRIQYRSMPIEEGLEKLSDALYT